MHLVYQNIQHGGWNDIGQLMDQLGVAGFLPP